MTAKSNDPYQLFIETTAGGFFNRQQRNTSRTEWQEIYQFGAPNFLGSHELKAGIDFSHNDYDGRTQLLPVSIIGLSSPPFERIDRVPLNIACFPLLPDRTILNLGSMGQALDSTPYVNTITGGLHNPRSVGWNVEFDREVTSALAVRAALRSATRLAIS
ncbi:MAG: hypothetical protein JO108_13275 [Acidobacteriaceae bacterium]|nr:hypothetical protein [Acidobacteriaceae bacterium]